MSVPGSAAADHDVGSEVPGADGVTDEEVTANREPLGCAIVRIDGSFITDTEVFREEEIQANSATGTGAEIGVPSTEEAGVEGVNLKFRVAKAAGIGFDNDFGFLERFSVSGEGGADRTSEDGCG